MYADCQTVSTATSFVLLLETFTIMLPQQESMTRTSFQEDGRNFRVAYYSTQQVKLVIFVTFFQKTKTENVNFARKKIKINYVSKIGKLAHCDKVLDNREAILLLQMSL